MPEFASILRQIRERGEDPYCGFEELLCEIIRQLEQELAQALHDRQALNDMVTGLQRIIADDRAAQSASEASIRLDECKRIMDALDKYPHASDYGPPIQERMRDLARSGK